jgi:hypothetical protein
VGCVLRSPSASRTLSVTVCVRPHGARVCRCGTRCACVALLIYLLFVLCVLCGACKQAAKATKRKKKAKFERQIQAAAEREASVPSTN